MIKIQTESRGTISLIVLDGWGIAPDGPGNAISLAKTPNFKSFWASCPHTQLIASGEAVGLPKGEEGNSETGHMNIGAGRIVYQELPRINLSIADGTFFENKAFLKAIENVRKNNSTLNLMGLIGSGGIHSNIEHLYALLRLAADQKIDKVFLHLFTDGRDSFLTSSPIYIKQIEEEIKKIGVGKIASICGRYYAMDRDNRWDRTQKTYEALTSGIGEKAFSPIEAVINSHKKGVTDEFILPTLIVDQNGQPIKIIGDNDSIIFFNFRVDRPRELTRAFVIEKFESYCPKRKFFDPYAERYGEKQFSEIEICTTFERKKILKNIFFVTMTSYEKNLPVEVAFPPPVVRISLPSLFSNVQERQFHLAETEKFPHVTTFFDGAIDRPYSQEEWIEVPSPKVATYDLQPEMSAEEVTNQYLKRIKTGMYRFSLVNFANPDMVGHTGNIDAAIKACEFTDHCLGIIVREALSLDGTIIVTADHGNVEEMIDLKTGQVDTKHSCNPVPFIVINKNFMGNNLFLDQGILADVAPTILNLAKIIVPSEMTGKSLLGY